jgi:hypothetical protein
MRRKNWYKLKMIKLGQKLRYGKESTLNLLIILYDFLDAFIFFIIFLLIFSEQYQYVFICIKVNFYLLKYQKIKYAKNKCIKLAFLKKD